MIEIPKGEKYVDIYLSKSSRIFIFIEMYLKKSLFLVFYIATNRNMSNSSRKMVYLIANEILKLPKHCNFIRFSKLEMLEILEKMELVYQPPPRRIPHL